MKKAIVGGLAVLALSAAAPAQAEAAPIKECGDVGAPGYGVYNITTRIVGCRQARSMARAQYYGQVRLRHGRQWWGPFRCTVIHQGIETDDVRCVRYGDGGVVRWPIGA
jgi:hypothetical protein